MYNNTKILFTLPIGPCDRTTPIANLLTSFVKTKWSSKFGYIRTGDEKPFSRISYDFLLSESKCESIFVCRSLVKGFLRSLEWIFEDPRNDLISFRFLCSGTFSAVSTFGRWGFTPTLVIMSSR